MRSSRKSFYLKILGQGYNSNISIPLVFPHQWVRSCLAVSVKWVVDGQLVEEVVVDTLKEAVDDPPILLAKYYWEPIKLQVDGHHKATR